MSDPQRSLVSLEFTEPALTGFMRLINQGHLTDSNGNMVSFGLDDRGDGRYALTSSFAKPEEGQPRILIGIPHLRPLEDWFLNSLLNVMASAQSIKPHLYLLEGRAVDVARTEILQRALERDCTHVLFLDSDMLFPPWLIARLLRLNADVASGLYFGRTRDLPVPHVYRFHHRDEDGATWYKPKGNEVTEYLKTVDEDWPETMTGPEPYIIDADAIGFGCCLIRTDLYRNWPKPWFLTDEGGGGEDFHFCELARAAGASIKVDLSIQCQHEIRGGVFVGRNSYWDDWVGDDPLDWDNDEEAIHIEVGPFGRRRRRPALVGIPQVTEEEAP